MGEVIPIQVQYGHGLHLPELDLWLDPHGKRKVAFVSHAHADHFAKHGTIICSERTHALIQARYGTKNVHVIPLAYGERYDFNLDYHLHLLPAGHIFGSSQIHLTRKSDGATLLYTGDFKLRESCSAETIKAEHADTLIMETTFGLPEYRFPPTSDVMASVVKFCRETLEEHSIPVLLAYSLGKAQEILAGLSGAELPIMVHKTVHDMSKVYAHFQPALFPSYKMLDVGSATGHVLIIPPTVARSGAMQTLGSRRMAMLSGWAQQSGAVYRYRADAIFPLSDHADYPDLMRYVELVKPSLVYTLHGYAAEFARDLREKGTEAWSIISENQLDLTFSLERDVGSVDERDSIKRVPCELADLKDVCQQVAEATGKQQQVALLGTYLRSLSASDLRRVAEFLNGMHLDVQVVRGALLKVSGVTLARYRNILKAQNDVGCTAYLVLNGSTTPGPHSLEETETCLRALMAAPGSLTKVNMLSDLLAQLHPSEGQFVVQLLTQDPRVRIQESLLEEALAKDQSDASVRKAHLNSLGAQPFTPVKCMRASPARNAKVLGDLLGSVWVEDKLHGIRAQLHRVKNRTALFSQALQSLDSEFAEVCQIAARDFEDDVILDGVFVAVAEGKVLSEADLKKGLGRKRLEGDLFLGEPIPVRMIVFDLLWHQGRSLVREPLLARRALLETIKLPKNFACSTVVQLNPTDALIEAQRRGSEGLIVKDPESTYNVGSRDGAWSHHQWDS